MHGWRLDSSAFLAYSKYLTEYKTIFVDLYGFGTSKIRESKNLLDYANGVIRIINDNNLKDVTLVGHSFGGKVAMLVASMSKNIKGLVLIDASGIKPRFSIKKSYKKLLFKLKKKLGLNVDKYGSLDYKSSTGTLRETFLKIVNTHLNKIIKKITQDTLILWGNKDKETPLYMAKSIHKKIKKSKIVLLQGDHFAYTKDRRFISILRAYLYGVYKN